MTLSIPAILCLLAAAATPVTKPATAPASTVPAGLTFTDDAQTFFVTVPATWKAGKLPKGRGGMLLIGPPVQSKPAATPIFRVQAGRQQPGAPDLTLDQFSREVVYQVTGKLPDDVKIEPVKLGGVEARKFNTTKKDSKGVEVDMQYVIVLQQARSFLFTYLQEKELFDPAEAKAIFDGVRWNK